MKLVNINRDYMVIIDVKSGSVNRPTMVFYNTDKNTSNIYVQLVVKETIVAATPIENATDYSVELKVVKPGNIVKFMDGVLVNEEQAIYEFDLPEDFTNLSGNYDIEFWVKAKVNDRDEMITSSKAKYTVKPSILTDLDEAIEDHEDYPLFLKLMEEVKVINETAHELDTAIRTLQADMIEANEEMKANEATRQVNEATRVANEATRVAQENAREEYLNTFDSKWEEYKTNTDADIADYKAQINAQEVAREQAEATREANEATREANENDRIHKENRRESQERDRVSNEYDRQNAEQSREYAEIDRATNEEIRQTNEANRETAEEIRKANEQARITAENARVTEHEQMKTELNEVKAENAVLMENDKKIADRMTQVEISDKRQYVIMEGLMNSAGDGYLKIEDTGNDTTLYNSVEGFVDVKNITGNTMVNSIKNPDDELTLNSDINTSGQSVTLTTAVDNGQVDVLAEGNTMVNVCDQQEAVAITKSYTVENGNHVALQGEFDGKARPVPTGNTLVNLVTTKSVSLTGDGVNRRNAKIYLERNLAPGDYTLIYNLDVNSDTLTGYYIGGYTSDATGVGTITDYNYTHIKGLNIVKATFNAEVSQLRLYIYSNTGSGITVTLDNLILLEGDYTNKPIPDYFTGMQSSFEDKVVPENLVDYQYFNPLNKANLTYENNSINITNEYGLNVFDRAMISIFKPGETYTVYTEYSMTNDNYLNSQGVITLLSFDTSKYPNIHLLNCQASSIRTITIPDDFNPNNYQGIFMYGAGGQIDATTSFKNFTIVEGDYTNYDFSDYDPTKAGKYRVDYKVTGKNKFDIDNLMQTNLYLSSTGEWISYNNETYYRTVDDIRVLPNTQYTLTLTSSVNFRIGFYCDTTYISRILIKFTGNPYTFTTPSNCNNIKLSIDYVDNFNTVQLEEGSTATTYEPYKESIKTYYLNSPLLEGDTIEESGGNVCHVHRYGFMNLYDCHNPRTIWNFDGIINGINWFWSNTLRNGELGSYIVNNNDSEYKTFSDKIAYIKQANAINIGFPDGVLSSNDDAGVKAWIENNKPTVVYKLASPQYERISQSDTILTDSYVAGHLDFDTAVPVENVVFKNINIGLKYLYPSTNYVIQFESDSVGNIVYSKIGQTGGYDISNISVTKGINKINFTTSNSLTTTRMILDGIGFSASNIVVTEATDKDFGYFSGMKSVGELEENKIEILSSNKNLFDTELISGRYTVGQGTHFTDVYAVCTKNKIKVKPSTIYTIILPDGIPLYNISQYSNDQFIFNNYGTSFTTTSNTNYINISLKTSDTNINVCLTESPNDTFIVHQSNKKQILLNEPLRAVGDTKDRFVKIDGNWYVERNVGKVVLDGSEDEVWSAFDVVSSAIGRKYTSISDAKYNNNTFVNNKSNYLPAINSDVDLPHIKFHYSAVTKTCVLWIFVPAKTSLEFNQYLSNNPLTVVYELASPTYEPVEIAPVLNTYTDVTHITNNSTIPMNMPIVNSGYEIIAKPSTKYTVVGMTNGRIGDSTIVNGTITTPATITDNFLRPYGNGKTSKVMLLEGEPANIPSYFKGIKSVFEDKVTEDGKYAVEVKVVGKNKVDTSKSFDCAFGSKAMCIKVKQGETYTLSSGYTGTIAISFYNRYDEKVPNDLGVEAIATKLPYTFTIPSGYDYLWFNFSSKHYIQLEEGTVASEYEPYHETKQTLYLDEPLYNANNITIYNDKLGYWKNWDKVVLDGNDNWTLYSNDVYKKHMAFRSIIPYLPNNWYAMKQMCDSFNRSDVLKSDDEGFCHGDTSGYIFIKIHKAKLPTLDTAGFRQYLQQNPVAVVYQLAKPVFVPLIDNCPNWVIGSWDNCSIHFDSIIPLKDTRYRYTGNVPSVVAMSDDVATVSDISDQQDSMIIDLATQVATMEMMLM